MDQGAGARQTPSVVTMETAVEILGYLGAAVGVAATLAAAAQIQDLSEGGALAIALVVAAGLLVAGYLFGLRPPERGLRMRSVLWFGAAEAWTVAVTIFIGEIAGLDGRGGAMVSSLLGVAIGAALWWQLRRSLQEVFLFLALLAVLVSLVFPDPSFFGIPDLTGMAMLIWAFGGVWLFLAIRRIVGPVRTGMVLGSVAAIVGPLLFTRTRIAGELLSLATAAGLLVLGEWLGDRAVQGLGIAGLLLVSGGIVVEHAGDSTGGAIAALVAGILLLAVALFVDGMGPRRPLGASALPPAPPPLAGGPPSGPPSTPSAS
jgi:hypothetical protein